uniref:Pentatricopeptide repeat-containing protein At2g45350ic n=1 Tax=Rhizophora mucronata TaxID=61149 RepID=A0A2P2QLG9_RHIMU
MLLCASSGQQPWNSPLKTLLLLQKCKSPYEINQIHARMITTGLIKNTCLTAKIVLSLSSSPRSPLVEFARCLFFSGRAFRGGGDERDPFLWNVILKTYSHGHHPGEALSVFCLMLENGILVDKFSLSMVLNACSLVGLVKEGMQIHGLLEKLEFGSDLVMGNCLTTLYVRCRCLEFARQVFDRMLTRDSVSYNSMIHGYIKHGKVGLARELFDSMPMEERNLISWNSLINGFVQLQDGLPLAWAMFEKMPEKDLISWNLMIHGCVKCGRMEDAQALFDRMPKRDMVSWASMVDGYAKVGKVDIARTLFDEMQQRDVVVCNAMIGGYVQSGHCIEALDIFYGMQCNGSLSPDETTLSIALSAVAQLGHLDKGVALHCYLEEKGFSLDQKLGVALIDMYSKCGSIENAMLVFEGIGEKGVDHWNAMICGLAIHGMGELAFNLLTEMGRLCVKPDDITFIGVLNACAHAGLLKEGMICFEIMRRVHKLEPKLQHYGCMVDILGRAGHLEAARKFIEEMPIEPNDVISRTLLSACRAQESLNVEEPVVKYLMRLDSSDSSSYVLLSNLYAGTGMWSDVRRIRTMMKERNLKKTPGCSWIELEGDINEFIVQDKCHAQAVEVYSLLDSLAMPNQEVSHCTIYTQ